MEKMNRKKPIVFLDVSIDGDPFERMTFELFTDVAPKTAENFRALCTGEKGLSPKTGKPLHYKGTIFHCIIKGCMARVGDLLWQDGKYGKSIYDGNFLEGSPKLKHDGPGLLSMSISDRDERGSLFSVTFKADHHLDGECVVFGKLVGGHEVLEKIENAGDEEGRPAVTVKITNSGELPDDKKKGNKLKMGKITVEENNHEVERKAKRNKKDRRREKRCKRQQDKKSRQKLRGSASESESDNKRGSSSKDNAEVGALDRKPKSSGNQSPLVADWETAHVNHKKGVAVYMSERKEGELPCENGDHQSNGMEVGMGSERSARSSTISPSRRMVSRSPPRTSSWRSPLKSDSRSPVRSSWRTASRSSGRPSRRSPSRIPVRFRISRSSGRAPPRRSTSPSPVREPSRTNRHINSRSTGRRARSPSSEHNDSSSRSPSIDGSPKCRRRGRAFSYRYSYAYRYRSHSCSRSCDRSPLRYPSYRRSSRRFRSSPRGSTPPRYRGRRSRTRSPSVSRSPIRYSNRRYSRRPSPIGCRSPAERYRGSPHTGRQRAPSGSRSRSRSRSGSP